MKRTLTGAAALALTVGVGATAAGASTMVIDDFSVNQFVQAASQGNPASSQVTGSMLGGTRFMQVFTSPGTQGGTSLNAELGVLQFNNGSNDLGTGWVIYDGGDAGSREDVGIGANVHTKGLGGVNFLMGAPDSFFNFSGAAFNQGIGAATAIFTAFAWDMDEGFSEYQEVIGGPDFTEKLFLSEFRDDWSDPLSVATVDWSNIGALAFTISSQQTGDINFDGTIEAITLTPIPLPASALLLLGGMGGLAGLSAAAKRRRKAS